MRNATHMPILTPNESNLLAQFVDFTALAEGVPAAYMLHPPSWADPSDDYDREAVVQGLLDHDLVRRSTQIDDRYHVTDEAVVSDGAASAIDKLVQCGSTTYAITDLGLAVLAAYVENTPPGADAPSGLVRGAELVLQPLPDAEAQAEIRKALGLRDPQEIPTTRAHYTPPTEIEDVGEAVKRALGAVYRPSPEEVAALRYLAGAGPSKLAVAPTPEILDKLIHHSLVRSLRAVDCETREARQVWVVSPLGVEAILATTDMTDPLDSIARDLRALTPEPHNRKGVAREVMAQMGLSAE